MISLFKHSAFPAVFFLGIALISCENDLSDVEAVSSIKNTMPLETAKKIEIIYSDSARVKARVLSPVLYHFDNVENPYYEMPRGVLVTFYESAGDTLLVESTLSSRYAIRYEKRQVMEVSDSVVVLNKKGEKLNTEHLVWDENTQRIYSDKFVKITTRDKVIYGDGFESNQDFSSYRIFKIKGVVSINDGGQDK